MDTNKPETQSEAAGGASELTVGLEAMPCPFCGRASNIHDSETLFPTGARWRETDIGRIYHRQLDGKDSDGWVWGMHCPESYGGCGAEIHGDTKDEALAKWNRRASNG